MRCFIIFLPVVLAWGVVTSGCGSGASDVQDAAQDAEDASDGEIRFRNLSAEFTGDEACFDCHEEQYRGFQEHGMANSFYPMRSATVVEDFTGVTVQDPKRGFFYRPYREGDRFWLEEFRRGPDEQKTHSLIREIEYVVGSGTAARTYLVEEGGRYFELPLTWYTQEERWDLSPGYEVSNTRFDRLIPDRCMACHNSYPHSTPFAEGKYEEVPNGIGCERCHGPGSVHVEARLASPEPAGDIDETIVNPAHLSLERRLDVCQQCHLHTTVSMLRDGRTAYDYRPSRPLSEHMTFYVSDAPDSGEEIDAISHADLMKQSACFIETQTWEEPMDCMTCHNPHEAFRLAGPDYFNATCMTCHDTSALQAALPAEATRAVHTEDAHCFSCHMPKASVQGTPHTSLTDHRIRVVGEREQHAMDGASAVASSGEAPVERIRLRPYYAVDDSAGAYAGMAYVIRGLQQQDTTALRHGVTLLSATAGAFGEAQYLLGYGYMQLGEMARAVEPLEQAVALEPKPERLNALAQTYERLGREGAAIRDLYERALAVQPALASVRVNYGRYLETQGELDAAVAQYQASIAEYPWLEAAHFNLGTARLRQGDRAGGERSLREAVRLNPDGGQALGNLGLLLAGSGRLEEARTFFEQAVRVEPDNPVGFGNLGALHLNEGRPDIAVQLFARAVELDPSYVDGLVNLALAYYLQGDDDRARMYAERALRLAPNHPQARQILDAV